jgi:hypothetical protein
MNPDTQAPQSPEAPPTTLPQPQPKIVTGSGNKKKMLLIGLVVAVLAVAGIAYGVYAYITNSPDYIMRQAVTQLGKQEAFAAKFKLTSGSEGANVTMSGDFAARGDMANGQNGELVIGLGTGDSRVTLTTRVIDGALFVRAGSLTNLSKLLGAFSPETAQSFNTPEFTQMISGINNQWFTLSKEEIQQYSQMSGGASVSEAPSPDELKKVVDIYDKHPFLKADKSYPDEVVEGTNSAHFNLKIDQQALGTFLTEVKAANLKSFKVTDEDIAEAKKQANLADVGTVEVWVTRDTKQLKQLKFTSTDANSPGSLTLTLVTDLPKLEKLEKPANAKPFSEITSLLLGPVVPTQQPTLPEGFDPNSIDPSLLENIEASDYPY